MNEALISIIIPTYNRAHLIGETLDSIIAQSYQNWECIIIDDGSTDDTKIVLAQYINNDIRFQYHNRPNSQPKGANACRNYGFELSKGKYIKWFDSDDLMLPEFLEKQITFLENNQDFDFVASLGEAFVVENNINVVTQKMYPKVTSSQNLFYNYVLGNIHFMTPAPLWRKTFLIDKALFNLEMCRSQEAEFNFRMLLSEPKFKYLGYCGFQVRRGHDSIDSQSVQSLPHLLSVVHYFDVMFQKLWHLEFDKKEEILRYIFFRQAVNVYTILTLGVNIQERLNNEKQLNCNITEYANQLHLNNSDKLKLETGLFLAKTFGKGYQLLYFKKFDCR